MKGALNKLMKKPLFLKRKEWYKRGREKPQVNGVEANMSDVWIKFKVL